MTKDINITVDTFNSTVGFIDTPWDSEIYEDVEEHRQSIEAISEGSKDSMVQRCVYELTKIITEAVDNMSSSRTSFCGNRHNVFSLDVQIRTYDRSQVSIKGASGKTLHPECKDFRLPYEKTSSKINPFEEKEYWEGKHAK